LPSLHHSTELPLGTDDVISQEWNRHALALTLGNAGSALDSG
jgi:hypothetical protein